ncbi:MAG: YkgJ family cysteine cluster protein [Planctomycetaceae bacterium]|nr:YkgJ family cysteine cluster protein [Planctomycetaceae bacterium]
MTEDRPASANSDDPAAPWYREGLSFNCTQCGNCCTGGPGAVWVSDAEIEAIAAHLGENPLGFRTLHTRQIGGRRSLLEHANGDCVYLSPATRRCQIYEARPVQCRVWPFWPELLETPEAWQAASRRCPGIGRGDVIPLEAVEVAAAKMALK